MRLFYNKGVRVAVGCLGNLEAKGKKEDYQMTKQNSN